MSAMLQARRHGIVTREYEVVSDGAPLTTLVGGKRESSEFSLPEGDFRVERESRGRFLLHGPGGRVATAERDTGRAWTVKATSGNLKLVKPSFWRSEWQVQQRGSAQGVVKQEGMFKRTYSADVPGDVPQPVAVFTLYVALVIHERQAGAAAAGG